MPKSNHYNALIFNNYIETNKSYLYDGMYQIYNNIIEMDVNNINNQLLNLHCKILIMGLLIN